MMNVGSFVRRVGGDTRYRVIEAGERFLRVEAVDTEVVMVDGRKARPIHYSEKRALLSVASNGTLFDDRWRCWEVLS